MEIAEDKLGREDGNGEEIPYDSMVINDIEKINVKVNISQMQQGPYLVIRQLCLVIIEILFCNIDW